MKIKDSTGQEIEVYTPQEVEQKTQKAIDDYKIANPDQTEKLKALETTAADTQRKLDEALNAGDTEQVKRLRQERDDANKKFVEGVSGVKKEFEDFRSTILGDQKGRLLDAASGGNQEIRKKIELEFDNYKPTDNTPAGIAERMAIAAQIVTGRKPAPGMLDAIAGGAGARGGGGSYVPSQPAKEVNQNTKAIGEVLGVSDEDRKWYDEKFSKKNKPLK